MENLILRYEVIYWLVVAITAYFSFSLPGLLLAAFGNIFIRDGFSLARGLSVLWFIAIAVPLVGQPTSMEKIIGSAGIVAAMVIFFFTFSLVARPRQGQMLVVIYSTLVLITALLMLWTKELARLSLQSSAWIPAVVFFALSLYSLLLSK